jgi:hypothetical protein
MNLMPDLLLHPNLPKPIHGLNPRTIKGDEWWNEQRQIAYKKNNYCCWACGVDKRDAQYHQWLEAHEIYKIDYSIGEVRFNGICALCHCCHNFIHSGRLSSLYRKKELSLSNISFILEHGFVVLKNAKLKMNPFALRVAKEHVPPIFNKYFEYGYHEYGMCLAEWNDWYLLMDGKKYKGKFKNFNEWNDEYN